MNTLSERCVVSALDYTPVAGYQLRRLNTYPSVSAERSAPNGTLTPDAVPV